MILPICALVVRLFLVSLISPKQDTCPQSMQTKCGCPKCSCSPSPISSNRQTRSPSSVRRSKPASVISFNARKAVALSTPVFERCSATSAWVSGDEDFCSNSSVATRAGVALKPASRITSLLCSTADSDIYAPHSCGNPNRVTS